MKNPNERRSVEELYALHQLTREEPVASDIRAYDAREPDADVWSDAELSDLERLYLRYQSEREPEHSAAIRKIVMSAGEIVEQKNSVAQAQSIKKILGYAATRQEGAEAVKNRAVAKPQNFRNSLYRFFSAPVRIIDKLHQLFLSAASEKWLAMGVPLFVVAVFTVTVVPRLIESYPSSPIGDHRGLLNNAEIASTYIQVKSDTTFGFSTQSGNRSVGFQLGVLAADVTVAQLAGNTAVLQSLVRNIIRLGEAADLQALVSSAVVVGEHTFGAADNPDLKSGVEALLSHLNSASDDNTLYKWGSDTEALYLAAHLAINTNVADALADSFNQFEQSANAVRPTLSIEQRALLDDVFTGRSAIEKKDLRSIAEITRSIRHLKSRL